MTNNPTQVEPVEGLVERLRKLRADATPGPYRAHDHNNMAFVGEDPAKWVGYGWVGRITKSSGPNGNFDARWLNADRRKDGCKDYRERASADVHFVAETLNALPTLLEALTQASEREAKLVAENERLTLASAKLQMEFSDYVERSKAENERLRALLSEARDFVQHCIGSSYHDT